ncbi:hypothetical protein Ddye_008881 [Dipteronia dyeriana]|uniref:SOSEKI DIX-like domain-containing protein n=1 Tax=Dipteronia dyeriana TaxID=168575 RepID=A0AAD9XAJ9_9ROSI|nr:hypothetical protein Ddye_008881 [Dipteronia dyeriana]
MPLSSPSSSPVSGLNKPKYMEVLGSRRRSARGSSPDRAKVVYNNNIMQPNTKPITGNNVKPIIINKKVQVVYYLTRNGHLEHPHYMEVTHFSNQHLRLRDVIDRLTVLRGKGMPSLYSWSCKRSYKNGYVWNDLAENDIIHPADNGGEYVLKGSELLLDPDQGCSEKFRQLQVSNSNRVQVIHQESNYNLHSKSSKPLMNPSQHGDNSPEEYQEHEEEEEEEDDDADDGEESYEDEDHKSTSYTSSTTPHSRCSRGVSTNELDDQEPETHHQLSTTKPHKNPKTTESISTTHHHPDNSTDHSLPPPSSILSHEKPNSSNNTSRRFEDGDPDSVSRNSVLLQLISCGSLAVSKAKTTPGSFKQSGVGGLRKGVVCRSAVAKVTEEEEIKFMSENPRFGNLQSEEKEYFSGSIAESMSTDRVESAQPILKKSNSYNEERSSMAGMEETKVEEERRSNDGVKGKCIPRKKSILSSKKKIKKDH